VTCTRWLSVGVLFAAALAFPVHSLASDPEHPAEAVLQQAKDALASGNYERAAFLYASEVRSLVDAGVNDDRLGSALLELGRLRAAVGKCSEASALDVRGIRLLEAAPQPDPLILSEAWEVLAKAYNCLRRYSKAGPALLRAVEIERSAPSPRPGRLVELLAGQGEVYQAEHRFAEAENAFSLAQSIVGANPRRIASSEAALVENNFGMLLRLMGRNEESEAAFRQGLELVAGAAPRDPALQVALTYNLASLQAQEKRFREAAGGFAEATLLLDHGTSLPPRAAGQLLRDYASCLRKLGRGGEARALDARAAALFVKQPEGDRGQTVDVAEFTSK